VESTGSSFDERNLRCGDVMIEINDHAICDVSRSCSSHVLCLSNVIVDLSHLYRQNFPGNLKTESGIAVSLQRMRSQNVCVNVCTCTGVPLAVSRYRTMDKVFTETSICDMNFIIERGKQKVKIDLTYSVILFAYLIRK
jgi:hypothetical protein